MTVVYLAGKYPGRLADSGRPRIRKSCDVRISLRLGRPRPDVEISATRKPARGRGGEGDAVRETVPAPGSLGGTMSANEGPPTPRHVSRGAAAIMIVGQLRIVLIILALAVLALAAGTAIKPFAGETTTFRGRLFIGVAVGGEIAHIIWSATRQRQLKKLRTRAKTLEATNRELTQDKARLQGQLEELRRMVDRKERGAG